MLKACGLPADIGTKALTQARVEQLWIADRSALMACYRKHLALRDFYTDRDAKLRGGK